MPEKPPSQQLPPLVIEYADDELYEVQEPHQDIQRRRELFRVCTDALSFGAIITNPLPAYIGGLEKFHMLKIKAAEENLKMYSYRSDGTCGIIE
jgi:hypothetical protein